MLSKKLNQALNEQMNNELYSAYFYLGARSYFEEQELGGFANFFRIQANEELGHATKIFDFIHRAGGEVEFFPIAAPKINLKSPLDAFEQGLKQEQDLGADINNLLTISTDEGHGPTRVFMFWFVNEQVEEEALFTRCIRRIQMVGKDGQGIFLLDKEFAERKLDTEGAKE